MLTTNNVTVKPTTIDAIEHLDEETAKALAEEYMEIKGHQVYFSDLEGHFGYSALVFCNGHHIHYANDYELHHQGKTHEELKKWYIDGLNNILFTAEELSEPVKTYDEYKRKEYFIRNYYGMREDYVSAFRIAPTEKEEKAFKKSVEHKYYNPVCFAYYDNEAFVKECVKLYVSLQKAKQNTLENFGYWKNAFLTEMFNHEYGINWQADFDTLSAFGNPKWRQGDNNTLEKWFKDCGLTALQKKAYREARAEYYKIAEEKGYI